MSESCFKDENAAKVFLQGRVKDMLIQHRHLFHLFYLEYLKVVLSKGSRTSACVAKHFTFDQKGSASSAGTEQLTTKAVGENL